MERGNCLKAGQYFPNLPSKPAPPHFKQDFSTFLFWGIFDPRLLLHAEKKKHHASISLKVKVFFIRAQCLRITSVFIHFLSCHIPVLVGEPRGCVSPPPIPFSRFGHGAELEDINSRPPSLPPFLRRRLLYYFSFSFYVSNSTMLNL